MLIYDILTINGTIHFYDDCTRQCNTIYLNTEVFSKLLFLKKLKLDKYIPTDASIRAGRDNAAVK